jgi:hypothetical protein
MVLSSKINERGFVLIEKFCRGASRNRTGGSTGLIRARRDHLGAVTGINQIARLQAWLTEQGYPVKKLDRKAIEKLLKDAELMPALVQRVPFEPFRAAHRRP